jgi:phosphonate transport system substrate-binding protein
VQRWLSFLAPSLRPLYRLAADRVAAELEVEVELHQGHSYAQLSDGGWDFAWVCGLPYVELVDGLISALTPVAAPVLQGARFSSRPVYFSDVIVAARSPYRSFDDLRGGRWAYNEPGSHSGYLATLHRLATAGEDTGFFSTWIEAGYHQASIRMVAAGDADGSAIDSQVLAVALDLQPELGEALRVVDSLGPSPIQPLVAAPSVSEEVWRGVRQAVLGVGSTDDERRVLEGAHVERLVAVDDGDYDDVRRKLEKVRMAGLWSRPRPEGLRPPTGSPT